MQALLLPVGEDWYALELDAVREVVPRPVVTPVPRAPAGVLGVLNLRGEVVPVLDTARLLGVGHAAAAAHVAVAETARGPAALAADGLPVRVTLGDPAGAAELPAGLARFTVGDGVATLLDAESLVGALEER